MDDIKMRIHTLCLISIFSGLTGAAIPRGRLKNAFSAFCAVVIVFSTVAPLAEFKTDGIRLFASDSAHNEQMLLSDVKTAEASVYETVLGRAVEKELEKSGYAVSVKAYCRVDGDEISITGFTVTAAADEEAKNTIEAYLKKSFGDIRVNFEETDNNE